MFISILLIWININICFCIMYNILPSPHSRKTPTIHLYDLIKIFPSYNPCLTNLSNILTEATFSLSLGFYSTLFIAHSSTSYLLTNLSLLIDQIFLTQRAYAILSDYSQVSVNVY